MSESPLHIVSKDHFRLALEEGQLGTWEWEVDSGRIIHSAGFERILQAPGAVKLAHRDDYFTWVHHDDLSELKSTIAEAQRQRRSYRHQHRLVTATSSRPIWIMMRGDYVAAKPEDSDTIIGTISDVTETRYVDEQLRQKEVLLSHMSRLSTMGEMVAGIAHEVNQPLYSIVNFASASGNVLAREGEMDVDQLRIWNAEMGRAARRAADIVKRLTAFVSRHSPILERIDLHKVIHDSIELVRFEARQSQARITTSLAEGPLEVNVVPVEIQQLIVNLLRNAIAAVSHVEGRERTVEVLTARTNETVEIHVRDNGIGLPQDVRTRLFEPFVTTKDDGMGLGLAISRKIVLAHGGSIEAADGTDHGAVFQIDLPLVSSTEP